MHRAGKFCFTRLVVWSIHLILFFNVYITSENCNEDCIKLLKYVLNDDCRMEIETEEKLEYVPDYGSHRWIVSVKWSRILCVGVEKVNFTLSQLDSEHEYFDNLTFLRSNIGILNTNSFIGILPLKINELFINESNIKIIETGAFTGLTYLKKLQLETNRIERISKGIFNSMINLTTLDLHNNRIKSIEDESFHGLNYLNYLDLSFNNLEDIPTNLFNTSPLLQELRLSHNFLHVFDLNLRHLLNLMSVHLDNNRLGKINKCFMGTIIRFLKLDHNALTNVEAKCFPNTITNLTLNCNRISIMNREVFVNLTRLESLDISSNKIEKIPVALFKDLTNIKMLNLSNNTLYDLPVGAFSSLEQLQSLNLSHTHLKRMDVHTFIPLTNLRILDISNNNLTSIDPGIFDFFKHFQQVVLGGNNIPCSYVADVLSASIKKDFSVAYHKELHVHNIKGIGCREEAYIVKNVVNDTNENLNNIINIMNVRETKLDNFISELLDREKVITEILSSESITLNKILESFRKTEETFSESPIENRELNERVREQIPSFSPKPLEKSSNITVDARLEVFRQSFITEIEKASKKQQKKFDSIERKFEELSFWIRDLSSSNKPKNTMSGNVLAQEGADSISQNETNKIGVQNLNKSIFDIKVTLIAVLVIALIIFVTVGMYNHYRNRRNSFQVSQEMPILRTID